MTAASAYSHQSSEIDRIFGPVVEARTYRNLLFALISFPLAIVYFASLIAGFAIGAGTAILFAGLIVLAMTLSMARLFGRLEREIAKAMLGATFHPYPATPRGWRASLTDSRSWRTMLYLLLRFPLSILSFTLSLMMIAPLAMMAAPLLYTVFPYRIDGSLVGNSQEALLVSLFGCALFLILVHAINGLAAITRRLAMAML